MPQPILTEKVWELLSQRLRRFISARIKDEGTADDLLQEVFLRIHRKLPTLQDEDRLESWVFRIARNLVNDHFRRSNIVAQLEPSDDSPERAECENQNHEVANWLPEAVSALPNHFREAVQLYELNGMPQQEIADKLNLSLSGAKSRIQRGREKLKETLLECCAFQLDRRGNVIDYDRRNVSGNGCCMDNDCR